MRKNKITKIVFTFFLLLLALWVAVPKVYIHDLLHHNHSSVIFDGETKLKSSENTEDCDFEEYNKPVYFNIFNFINNFLPFKQKEPVSFSINSFKLSSGSFGISLLRAPPLNY